MIETYIKEIETNIGTHKHDLISYIDSSNRYFCNDRSINYCPKKEENKLLLWKNNLKEYLRDNRNNDYMKIKYQSINCILFIHGYILEK